MNWKKLLFLATTTVAFNYSAVAQELQIDTKALDTAGIVSTHPAKNKKRKSAPIAGAETNAGAADQSGHAANRQFGELEGWSPGKEPPPSRYAVKKHNDIDSQSEGGAIKPTVRPTGMSGGNVGMGMSF